MSAPWLTSVLGPASRFKMEAAWNADPSDADGSSWIWTEITGVRHASGTSVTVGRSDNVSQAGSAKLSFAVDNSTGDYTASNPLAVHTVRQNVPIRMLLSLDGFATFSTRYQGYLDSANPTTAPTGTADKQVKITALGMLGRLQGRKKPFKTPMYRVMTTKNTPVAYWSFEDGTQATEPSPGIVGGPKLSPAPASTFTMGITDKVPLGSLAAGSILHVSSASATRSAPVGNGWTVAFAFKISPTASNDDVDLISWFTNTVQTTNNNLPVGFRVASGRTSPGNGNAIFGLFDESGNSYGSTTNDYNDGQWHTVVCSGATSGSNVATKCIIDGVTLSGTYTNIAAGRIRAIGIGPGYLQNTWFPQFGLSFSRTPYTAFNSDVQIMHLGFYDAVLTPDTANALDGYTGETMTARLTRLCAEENIDLDLTGTSDTTMGPQGQDTLINLLRDCESADHGMLYDGFGPGIGYQCRSARYDEAAALMLDMGANPPQVAPPFAPIFDRQAVKNLYAVNRKDGGSATYELTAGQLGTASIGIEDATATVNIDSDNPLEHHASWLVTLGTIEGFRYPAVQLNMRGIPGKAAALLAAGAPGWRLTINNPASKSVDLPPDPIDVIVEGWTETTTASTWELALNCSPYAPWQVAVVDSVGLVSSAHTSAAQPLTTTATALPIIPDAAWTTSAGDMPFDINYGGERCTVTALATAATPLSRVGAFLSSSSLGASDFSTAYTNWQAITGITMGVTRFYQAQGDFSISTNLSQIVAAGMKVCLTIRPGTGTIGVNFNPIDAGHLASLDTMLSTLKASGAVANVTLWHEPFFSGLSADQFVALVKYYGPTVRKYFPLWFVCSGADADAANGFYPGDAYVDGVAVDAYAASGQTQITNAQAIADAGGKPFGIWEFNGGADLGSATPVNGQTQTAITNHFQFLQTLFTNRLASGKPNGDLLLFNSDGAPNGSKNFLGTSLSANGGFEGGLGTWVGAGNSTLAQTGTQHNSGSGSLQMTSNAAGNVLASHTAVALANLTANALPCASGDVIAVSAWYKASTVARTCQTAIFFYDATAVQVGTAFPAGAADNTTTWTRVDHHATAPASTAFAVLRVQVVGAAAAGEVHFVDDPQIAKMPTPNDLTSPIQYPWDYRVGLLSTMKTALDGTSFGQTMTVTRSINGIVKAHPAGDPVDVWTPALVGL